MTREEKLQQFAEQNTKGLHLDRHNLIQMVKQGAEWADQHPQWIPVEERLPDEGQEVFAWNGTFKESYKCIYHDGLFEDYLGELGKGAVSHWMPIVPPRKEE